MEYRSAAAMGILYAEDFDAAIPEPEPEPAPEPQPEPAPPTPDLEAEIDRAVEAARMAWTLSDSARRTTALETLASGLADLRAEARHQAEEVAEALAAAALSAVAALLPRLSATHGPAEVRDLLDRLLPPLARAAPVTIRVHPSLVEPLRGDLAALGEDLAAKVELREANLPPGDARLDWPDGSLTRDTAAIQAAIRDGFAQLGLLLPIEEPEHA